MSSPCMRAWVAPKWKDELPLHVWMSYCLGEGMSSSARCNELPLSGRKSCHEEWTSPGERVSPRLPCKGMSSSFMRKGLPLQEKWNYGWACLTEGVKSELLVKLGRSFPWRRHAQARTKRITRNEWASFLQSMETYFLRGRWATDEKVSCSSVKGPGPA